MFVPEEINLERTWRLGDPLGEGGFAEVYLAMDEDGEPAVVKLIPKEPRAERELLFEELDGAPNVVPVLDRGECCNYWVLVMPRAQKSLRAHLDETGRRLTLNEAVAVLADISEAGGGGGRPQCGASGPQTGERPAAGWALVPRRLRNRPVRRSHHCFGHMEGSEDSRLRRPGAVAGRQSNHCDRRVRLGRGRLRTDNGNYRACWPASYRRKCQLGNMVSCRNADFKRASECRAPRIPKIGTYSCLTQAPSVKYGGTDIY